jgi:hypothetical protein
MCSVEPWGENFMSNKFFKVIFASFLSIGLIGQTSAAMISGLVEGEIYQDSMNTSLLWEYYGFYDQSKGPNFLITNGVIPVNGLKAAVDLFPELAGFDIALAAFGSQLVFDDNLENGTGIVNHLAWYQRYEDSTDKLKEDLIANQAGDDTYDAKGDASAYIIDRNNKPDTLINYVFKAVKVPEPSTLAIIVLALCGLGARRFKRA